MAPEKMLMVKNFSESFRLGQKIHSPTQPGDLKLTAHKSTKVFQLSEKLFMISHTNRTQFNLCQGDKKYQQCDQLLFFPFTQTCQEFKPGLRLVVAGLIHFGVILSTCHCTDQAQSSLLSCNEFYVLLQIYAYCIPFNQDLM